jgi:Uncharacterized protein conserved in bacteria (DUF2188)/Ribosomal protein S10p/S20e
MSKQKIRIRLKALDYKLIDKAALDIVDVAKKRGLIVKGPVTLPTRMQRFDILKRAAVKPVLSQFEAQAQASKHVIPNADGGWAVKSSGASRASRVFETQDEAIDYGVQAAKLSGSELYIHDFDGTIIDKNSYTPGMSTGGQKKQ